MQNKHSLSFRDLAARSGAPQTRAEVDAMLARVERSAITVFARQWLALDDELVEIRQQAVHVKQVLSDKVLAGMLDARIDDISTTISRRAADLARLPAEQPADIGVKCYIRTRMRDLAPASRTIPADLCQSILKDVDALGIRVDSLERRSH